MPNEKCNGWTNYMTWAVFRDMSDHPLDEFAWKEHAKTCKGVGELANEMRVYYYTRAPVPDDIEELYANLVKSALVSVNWVELAKYFMEN